MAKPDKKPQKNPVVATLRARFTEKTGKPLNNAQMTAKLAKLQRKAYQGERLVRDDREEALQEALTELGLVRG